MEGQRSPRKRLQRRSERRRGRLVRRSHEDVQICRFGSLASGLAPRQAGLAPAAALAALPLGVDLAFEALEDIERLVKTGGCRGCGGVM